MSRTLITHAQVILTDEVRPDHAILIEGGHIARIAPTEHLGGIVDAEVLDAAGQYVAPGFIDLHIHGLGEQLIDHGPDDLATICRQLPRYGVTGFLPTVCPRPSGQDAEFLAKLAAVRSEGARILGFHLEGPFLSILGALPPEALGAADPQRVRRLIEAAGTYPAIFSISPEFEGVAGLLPIMTAAGRPAFITHTAATVEQTQAAIAGGVRHATHFYDVFPCPDVTDAGVRPCGAVEAVLADPSVSVDFILDGEHVDPVAVQLALQCKGPDRVCLITDATIGAGLPPGTYTFAGNEIAFAYAGAPARMTDAGSRPGTLAGSGLTLDQALRNAMRWLNVDLPLAVGMVSANPARLLGLQDTKGRLAEGCDADLVWMDKTLHVQQTWVDGERIFAHPGSL